MDAKRCPICDGDLIQTNLLDDGAVSMYKKCYYTAAYPHYSVSCNSNCLQLLYCVGEFKVVNTQFSDGQLYLTIINTNTHRVLFETENVFFPYEKSSLSKIKTIINFS